MFIAVPPIIEVSHSAPDLWRWFINLAWVRFITRRPAPELPGPEEMGSPNPGLVNWQNEKKGISNSQTSFTVDQPRLGVTQQLDNSYGITEHHGHWS